MNSKDRPVLTVESLLAMRSDPDAIRVVTERLGVKEMGPADHIRTKHEAKMFIESGSPADAKKLLAQAAQRRETGRHLSAKVVQERGQRLSQ